MGLLVLLVLEALEFIQTLLALLHSEVVGAVEALMRQLLALLGEQGVAAQALRGLLVEQPHLEPPILVEEEAVLLGLQTTLLLLALTAAQAWSSFVCQAQSWLHSPAV